MQQEPLRPSYPLGKLGRPPVLPRMVDAGYAGQRRRARRQLERNQLVGPTARGNRRPQRGHIRVPSCLVRRGVVVVQQDDRVVLGLTQGDLPRVGGPRRWLPRLAPEPDGHPALHAVPLHPEPVEMLRYRLGVGFRLAGLGIEQDIDAQQVRQGRSHLHRPGTCWAAWRSAPERRSATLAPRACPWC